jgi:hypothetical protein
MAGTSTEEELAPDMSVLDLLAVLLWAGGWRCAGGAMDDDGRSSVEEEERMNEQKQKLLVKETHQTPG